MNKVHDARRCATWQAITDVYFTEEEYDLVKKVFPYADLSGVTIV